jgi:hypothetical protein
MRNEKQPADDAQDVEFVGQVEALSKVAHLIVPQCRAFWRAGKRNLGWVRTKPGEITSRCLDERIDTRLRRHSPRGIPDIASLIRATLLVSIRRRDCKAD